MSTTTKFLIIGGAAVAAWYLFLRPRGSAAPSAAASMPAGNQGFAAAYPGSIPRGTLVPPPTVFTAGEIANAITPPNDQPLSQLAPASPIAGGAMGSGALAHSSGRLGSTLVPGSSAGTGNAPNALAFPRIVAFGKGQLL